ncbi:cytochrome c peroxidase [Soonwooa sp.]|uniref:cytochrome c peroxidase n=1 Tax=Soonwooa sp. TaxID=1938592 RepID=UPI0028A72043|nr:cytochrome c peroxidase [Soonwooa sp.]
MLFFDPKLSKSNQISCSTGHHPELCWTDGRCISLGNDHLQGSRNIVSILKKHCNFEITIDKTLDAKRTF